MGKATANHAKAPQSARFVDGMRAVFGADQVSVQYVKEGDFELGVPGMPIDRDAASNAAERKDGLRELPGGGA